MNSDDQKCLMHALMPRPPNAPKIKRQLFDPSTISIPDPPDFSHLLPIGVKERHEFYESTDETENLAVRSFYREELRHREAQELEFTILFESDFHGSHLELACRISCRNLSVPHEFKQTLPVMTSNTEGLFDEVLAYIPMRAKGLRMPSQ